MARGLFITGFTVAEVLAITEAIRRLRVYHASVDTAARAMNTLEDDLAEARSQVANLQRDHQAQSDLLNEASAATDSLRGEVELLAAEIDTLKAERDEAKNQATALITERDAASGKVASLQSRIGELEASQADFDRKLQLEVARVVASTGTTMPAKVTPTGDATQATDLHARFVASPTRPNKPPSGASSPPISKPSSSSTKPDLIPIRSPQSPIRNQ